MRLAIANYCLCLTVFLVLLGLKLDGAKFSWVWLVAPIVVALVGHGYAAWRVFNDIMYTRPMPLRRKIENQRLRR